MCHSRRGTGAKARSGLFLSAATTVPFDLFSLDLFSPLPNGRNQLLIDSQDYEMMP